jgi:hypothetical protein
VLVIFDTFDIDIIDTFVISYTRNMNNCIDPGGASSITAEDSGEETARGYREGMGGILPLSRSSSSTTLRWYS